ncbi:MAG: hypothetical protein O9341_00690 [Paucibacter sp.]|nr:hypothetical protein [Roseateles sp.]
MSEQRPTDTAGDEDFSPAPARPFDLGYSHRERKDGSLEVLREGRQVALLRGNRAQQLRQVLNTGSFEQGQQAMAKITGNYKRGNEGQATRHPRRTG